MIQYKGVNWYFYQGALLPRVPPYREIYLSKEEQRELLKISKALFLRYTNEWDSDDGEFWYIIKDKKEGLDTYKSKVRNQIKKGLKNCIVKKVDREIIANCGYDVYYESFRSYSTFHKSLSEDSFKKSILKSEDDFWAVYNRENILIAYANNFIEDNMCHYNTMKFHPKFLYLYPSYALIYTMNEYYLNQKKYLYVNDGARSIAHSTNIQEFLIQKFGFRKAYSKINIAYRLDIKTVIWLVYPLRGLVQKLKGHIFEKINIILKQEEIRRSYE